MSKLCIVTSEINKAVDDIKKPILLNNPIAIIIIKFQNDIARLVS